tara:strand:- start:80 stop:298 length:219 start_codon:yes stop_codon:yes gene_type:complete
MKVVEGCLYVNMVGERIRVEKKNAEMALYFASTINTDITVGYAHPTCIASITDRNITAGIVTRINSANTINV